MSHSTTRNESLISDSCHLFILAIDHSDQASPDSILVVSCSKSVFSQIHRAILVDHRIKGIKIHRILPLQGDEKRKHGHARNIEVLFFNSLRPSACGY